MYYFVIHISFLYTHGDKMRDRELDGLKIETMVLSR